MRYLHCLESTADLEEMSASVRDCVDMVDPIDEYTTKVGLVIGDLDDQVYG